MTLKSVAGDHPRVVPGVQSVMRVSDFLGVVCVGVAVDGGVSTDTVGFVTAEHLVFSLSHLYARVIAKGV